MDYITLNGKDSTDIQGLIIQSLPPITKPLIRTQIEEIDGRDGDIVTKLGYSAYDRTLTIGLHGDFDIDEIIAYFNSEGTAIFSNEPRKEYSYQIIEQIDFEKLLRFKTAEVTLHCQPFKFLFQEEVLNFELDEELLTIPNYSRTINGITATATNGAITVEGTGTAAAEFYIPITAVSLEAGNYTLSAYANGTAPETCSIRLIFDSPSNSFGGNYITLQNQTIVTLNSVLSETKSYNYLYFYIASGTATNFTLNTRLYSVENEPITVTNSGNVIARPIMTIQGEGTINISLNNYQIFVVELGEEEFITIDGAGMNAEKDGVLKNRLVTGNYDNFFLNVGKNTITFTGDVSQVTISQYSRWI